jgi:acetyl esterase/lipase
MRKKLLILEILFIIIASASGKDYHRELIYKQVNENPLVLRVYHPLLKPQEVTPALVMFFGGGWKSGNLCAFTHFAERYMQKGIAVVLVEYRTESVHGTTPIESLKDAKSAMRYLKAHADELYIDKESIISGGGSAGGHLAAACWTNDNINEGTDDLTVSAKPKALVLLNAVIDNGPDGYGYDRIISYYPDFSPIDNIKPGFPPTTFHLGTNDNLIPVSTGQLFKQRIEAAGGRCDLHLYEDGIHGFFYQEPYKTQVFDSVDQFLISLNYIK